MKDSDYVGVFINVEASKGTNHYECMNTIISSVLVRLKELARVLDYCICKALNWLGI